MSQDSKIEWTDDTWNPVRGCTKISPGCAHCYAETFAERWRGVAGHPYEQGFDLRLVPEKLSEPLKWKRPRRVFVNSMSDLFHRDVPRRFIAGVFGVMAYCRRHTFQVLTKRTERMRDILEHLSLEQCLSEAGLAPDFLPAWPLANVWLGTSVEDQARADERIPLLSQTPAAVRFLSLEPLLSEISLIGPLGISSSFGVEANGGEWGPVYCRDHNRKPRVDWVIVGGESGPGARPCNVEWIRSLVQQCRAAAVPVFVKQLGSNVVDECDYCTPDYTGWPAVDGPMDWETGRVKLRSRKGGDPSEWPKALRIREFPGAAREAV